MGSSLSERRTILEVVGPDGRGLRRLCVVDSGVSAKCAVCPAVRPVESDSVASLAGCCEFVGDVLDFSDNARACMDGTFCPSHCYADSKVFLGCPTRLEKLKDRKEQT